MSDAAETLRQVLRALGPLYAYPDPVRGIRRLKRDKREEMREHQALRERWDAAQAYMQHDPECDAPTCHESRPEWTCTCGLSDLLGEHSLMTEETSDDE